MGRKPKSIMSETLQSKVLEIALRHKAKRLEIKEYLVPQLASDSGLHRSVIVRAAMYDFKMHIGTQPTLETVKKLVDALDVALNPELEDAFYNAFTYASPRQLEKAQSYAERELQES